MATGRLSQEYRRVLGERDEEHLIKNKRLRNFVYRCSRATLGWLCDLCRIDFLADEWNEIRWRRKWWPQLVLAALLFNLAWLTGMLQRQYSYDFSRFRYEQLSRKLAEPDRANVSRLELQIKLQEANRELVSANASVHSEWPFVGQYTVLYYMLQVILIHVLISFQFVRHKTKLLAMRAILDESKEAATWARIVVDELEHLLRDSSTFVSSKCDQIGDNLTLSGKISSTPRASETLDQIEGCLIMSNSNQRLSTRHEQLKARLQQIALEGRLNRFQSSPKSRDLLHLVVLGTFYGVLYNFVFGFAMSNKYLRLVFQKVGKTLPSRLTGGATDMISMIYLVVLGILSTSFLSAMLTTTISDQMIHVEKLTLIMRHLIRINSKRVFKMIAIAEDFADHGDHLLRVRLENLNRALETDILVVILRWRLASRSFGLSRRPLTLFLIFGALITTSMPILFRLHSPYMPEEVKQVNLALGLFAISLTILSVLPLAILNQRWASSLGTLWSLVALLGRLESVPSIREHLMTSSSVAFLTLRREVSDPLQKQGRFACYIVSAPVTFLNLIRIIVWLVLLLGSLYDSQHNLSGSWLGNYMDDPFGLIGSS